MGRKLYIRNENGRYEEYKEPVQECDNRLYRKVGRRYEPCSMMMTEDLPEGVWVVVRHYGSKSVSNGKYLMERYMCMKASDIQDVSLAKLGGMERLSHYLLEHWDEIPQHVTRYELCKAIVGLLLRYGEERDG